MEDGIAPAIASAGPGEPRKFEDICPPASLVFRYALMSLPERYAPMVRRHLETCPSCRTLCWAMRRAASALKGEDDACEPEAGLPAFQWAGDGGCEGPDRRDWLNLTPYSYAFVGDRRPEDGCCKVTFQSVGQPACRPDRAIDTRTPIQAIMANFETDGRVVIFIAAWNPLLKDLTREAAGGSDRFSAVPVGIKNLVYVDDRVEQSEGRPTLNVSPTEAFRMSLRLAETEERFLLPSNAAVVAAIQAAMAGGWVEPAPDTRLVAVMPEQAAPSDHYAYEDELIRLGMGHLIRTP